MAYDARPTVIRDFTGKATERPIATAQPYTGAQTRPQPVQMATKPDLLSQPQTSGGFDWGQFQTFGGEQQGGGGGGAPSTGGGGGGAGFNQQFTAPTLDNTNDPGYRFRLDEGSRLLQNSAAARGTLLTGGTLRDLVNYNQNAASDEYQNTFNRALAGYTANRDTQFGNTDRALAGQSLGLQRDAFNQNTLFGQQDRLFGNNFSLAQLGLQAAGMGNSAAGQFGLQGTDILTGQGNAAAAGTIGRGNAIAGGIQAAANPIATFFAGPTGPNGAQRRAGVIAPGSPGSGVRN